MAYESRLATARLGQIAACAGGAFAYDDAHGADAIPAAPRARGLAWFTGLAIGCLAFAIIFAL